jgi:hypothetical protein
LSNDGGWYKNVSAGGGVTFNLAYQSTANDTVGGTTVSYGSLAIGVADANRVVAIGVWVRGAGNVASMTIGGVTATQVSSAAAANPSTTFSDIWYAAVPTGTTAAVSVTYSAAAIQSIVWAYRIITSTPTPTGANAADPNLASISTTLSVPPGGGGMNVYGSRNQTPSTPTWTNAVADNTQAFSGHGVGAATTTGTGSITVTAAALVTGGENAMSTAAWGP